MFTEIGEYAGIIREQAGTDGLQALTVSAACYIIIPKERRSDMDDEKNRKFYVILKEAYDGNIGFGDTESAGCISLAMSEQNAKPGEYRPDVDYSKAFERAIEEAQRLSDAAYDAGLDETGNNLNKAWHGLRLTARWEGLIPRD